MLEPTEYVLIPIQQYPVEEQSASFSGAIFNSVA